MMKAVKDRAKTQPSGGSGVKQGTRYGGGKQKEKPEHDTDESGKQVKEGKDPSMDAGCGSGPNFVTDSENKPLALAKEMARKASHRLKKDLAGK